MVCRTTRICSTETKKCEVRHFCVFSRSIPAVNTDYMKVKTVHRSEKSRNRVTICARHHSGIAWRFEQAEIPETPYYPPEQH